MVASLRKSDLCVEIVGCVVVRRALVGLYSVRDLVGRTGSDVFLLVLL